MSEAMSVSAPSRTPIGLDLVRTAKAVGRAFDQALAAAGGSLPVWLILLPLATRRQDSQRELADAVGIEGATLTHHLNALEAEGLLTRRRDPANRRVHRVELTAAGTRTFERLREAAVAFDRRLRSRLAAADVEALERLLVRLRDAVGDAQGPAVEP
jgi:MarR family transcriptional regulator for hemolysin